MSNVDRLLDELAKTGEVAGTNQEFSINFAAARKKLAVYGLRNPIEFILKFVQAASLNGSAASFFDLQNQQSLLISGWDPSISLEQISDRFMQSKLHLSDDAIGYLFIGLITLASDFKDDIQLHQQIEGEDFVKRLDLDAQLSIKKEALLSPSAESSLKITWPKSKFFPKEEIVRLIRERCQYSPIPIRLEAELIKGRFCDPKTLPWHQTFPITETIGWYHQPENREVPNLDTGGLLPTPKSRSSDDHFTSLRLLTSTNPMATISLLKAGVVLEERLFDLGIPGVVGAVDADVLSTDISGQRFRDSEELNALQKHLQITSYKLLADSIDNPYPLSPRIPALELNGKHYLTILAVPIAVIIVMVFFYSVFISITDWSADTLEFFSGIAFYGVLLGSCFGIYKVYYQITENERKAAEKIVLKKYFSEFGRPVKLPPS